MVAKKCLQEAIENNDEQAFDFFVDRVDESAYPLVFGVAVLRRRNEMAKRIVIRMNTFQGTGNILVHLCRQAAIEPEGEATDLAAMIFRHPGFCPAHFDEETFSELINEIRRNDELWTRFTRFFPLVTLTTEKETENPLVFLLPLPLTAIGAGMIGYFLSRS